MNLAKIRVIIPTYSRLELFKLCLHSVLVQTYQNFEIYIIDNSEDDSVGAYIKGINSSKIFYEKNKYNIGSYNNINKCFKNRGCDFFMVLTSDVILKNKYFEESLNFFKEDSSIDIVFSRVNELITNESIIKKIINYNIEDSNFEVTKITENSWQKNKIIGEKNLVLSSDIALKSYFYYGINPGCSIFENLIKTEYFNSNNIVIDFKYNSNAEEYRNSIELISKVKNIGYIAKPMKICLIHDDRLGKFPQWFRDWEEIEIRKELYFNNLRYWSIKNIKPDLVIASLYKNYNKYLTLYPDSRFKQLIIKEFEKLNSY
jgi:glycosyltransferase involved in cell wall biosynthesis